MDNIFKIITEIKEEIREEVEALKKNGERPPHLAAILVGNDGASLTYVGSKVRSCEQIGFDSTLIKLDEDISEDKLIANINKLNNELNKIKIFLDIGSLKLEAKTKNPITYFLILLNIYFFPKGNLSHTGLITASNIMSSFLLGDNFTIFSNV